MSEGFRTTPSEPPWSSSPGNGYQNFGSRGEPGEDDAGEAGKVLLVAVLGGLLSAAGYMVYRRLPDEQKERLHAHARSFVRQRVNELRQNFNI